MKYNKISINKLLMSEMGGGRREAVMEQVLMFKKNMINCCTTLPNRTGPFNSSGNWAHKTFWNEHPDLTIKIVIIIILL